MYKIVKTIERGKVFIAACPSAWEIEGNLFWPNKNVTKYRQDPNSIPGKDWKLFKCVVKTENIATFEEALVIEKSLISVETEEEATVLQKTINKNFPKKNYNSEIQRILSQETSKASAADLPDLPIESCQLTLNASQTQAENSGRSERCLSKPAASRKEYMYSSPSPVSTGHQLSTNSSSPTSTSSKSSNSSTCSNSSKSPPRPITQERTQSSQTPAVSVGVLFWEIKRLAEFVYKMQDHIKGLHVKVDRLLDIKDGNSPNTPTEDDIGMDFPLNNVRDVEKFERKLDGAAFKKKIVRNFVRYGGTSGKASGKKVAYQLIDLLLSRKLFTKFSWTGKSKMSSKIAFKNFKNIIQVFFEIVRKADGKMSKNDIENFFKLKILKYSKERANRINKET
ncbi:uncharacterized protein LOC129798138 [Phlebotomus papatasi]|uniref:uncharacterized protein LOC129798138 n=1 Tax=Phlebotomus papatasi TaxID=29031 RepID=UPI0024838D63|nr:uncharacterized protein LOC129798138 [Phlebotomus papatasi]